MDFDAPIREDDGLTDVLLYATRLTQSGKVRIELALVPTRKLLILVSKPLPTFPHHRTLHTQARPVLVLLPLVVHAPHTGPERRPLQPVPLGRQAAHPQGGEQAPALRRLPRLLLRALRRGRLELLPQGDAGARTLRRARAGAPLREPRAAQHQPLAPHLSRLPGQAPLPQAALAALGAVRGRGLRRFQHHPPRQPPRCVACVAWTRPASLPIHPFSPPHNAKQRNSRGTPWAPA